MGKSYNAKFEKTKFSREKTIIYDESDQMANDHRINANKNVRRAERLQNVQKAKEGEVQDQDAQVEKVKKEPKEYSTGYMNEEN